MTNHEIKINGVDVDKLVKTVDTIKAEPNLSDFKFRAETAWKSGGQSRTTIQSFYGVGGEDTSRSKPFVIESDEPPVLLGGNAGPNAVEIVLAGLASCLAVGFAYNAAAQSIHLDEITLRLEATAFTHFSCCLSWALILDDLCSDGGRDGGSRRSFGTFW